MTEPQVGFLYNIAAVVSKSGQSNQTNNILQSYYLMRCKTLTHGYGLPGQHFSPKIRCPHCCTQWIQNTEVKVQQIKLSKRQRQRLKSKKIVQNRKEYMRKKNNLLISNNIEQKCLFCKNNTITLAPKPQKHRIHSIGGVAPIKVDKKETIQTVKIESDSTLAVKPKLGVKKKNTNVYINALDVFSLQNKKNILTTTIIKEKPKINNSKKKKDKFAGLCQKAVLASAKLKEQKEKQNSLNLFLKPSCIKQQ